MFLLYARSSICTVSYTPTVTGPVTSQSYEHKPLLRSSSAGTPVTTAASSSLETDVPGSLSGEEGGRHREAKRKGRHHPAF